MHRNRFGELPASYYRTGPVFDPSQNVKFEWTNNYIAASYPFVLAANTPMNLLPSNPLRTYLIVQNKDGAIDMFMNFGSEATAFNGVIIIPRGNYELIGGQHGGAFCPSNSLWLFSTAAITGIAIEGILPPISPHG